MINIQNDFFYRIQNSKYFVVVGTEKYFKNITTLSQANYAKSLNKPFRIILQKGVHIPKMFLDGVEDYKIEEIDDIKNVEDIIKKLCSK